MSNEETFTVISCQDNKARAELLSTWANKTFLLLHAFPSSVEKRLPNASSKRQQWCVVLPAHCKPYTNVITEIRSGALNFWDGYEAAIAALIDLFAKEA